MPTTPDKNALDPEIFDVELEPHVLTDKQVTKLLPCVECRRACVVTTFMAAPKVKCKECKGDGGGNGRVAGSQAIVQPGRTDPSIAANLTDCLINPSFGHAVCPLDPEHEMELKDVVHAPNYGPRHLIGYKDDIPQYRTETGEAVSFQCKQCRVVVSYSNQHQGVMRRINEPRTSPRRTEKSSMETLLGVRDE